MTVGWTGPFLLPYVVMTPLSTGRSSEPADYDKYYVPTMGNLCKMRPCPQLMPRGLPLRQSSVGCWPIAGDNRGLRNSHLGARPSAAASQGESAARFSRNSQHIKRQCR